MRQHRLMADLNYILEHTTAVWEELKDKQVFITGGTGFIGSWLLETFAWANRQLALNLRVTVLTRDVETFARKAPHLLRDPALSFEKGDVRNFAFHREAYSHIIHAATSSNALHYQENPQVMLDTILQGTRHTLEFADFVQAQKFLFVSSGAVYGKQPADLTHVGEDYAGFPNVFSPAATYAIGKSTAEHMCVLHAAQHAMEMKIARCFAFVGPYLPLDLHFAVGNFIRDGLQHGDIQVHGDGTPYRSYQYAADLAIWLLRILCEGKSCVPYNVGSDEQVSIAELAQLVAKRFSHQPAVNIKASDTSQLGADRYVPSVDRARQQLGFKSKIGLEEALEKTISWYQYDKSY
jgi:nucleoside-diphosphate-sugar epimerase